MSFSPRMLLVLVLLGAAAVAQNNTPPANPPSGQNPPEPGFGIRGELTIVSAIYSDLSGARWISITAHLKKVFESGQPSLKLNDRDGADGKDPAPRKPKQTTITYTIGGEKKKKTFPEGYELKFREDLN